MNSFNFTLSGMHFICPSILNDSFAGESMANWKEKPLGSERLEHESWRHHITGYVL